MAKILLGVLVVDLYSQLKGFEKSTGKFFLIFQNNFSGTYFDLKRRISRTWMKIEPVEETLKPAMDVKTDEPNKKKLFGSNGLQN